MRRSAVLAVAAVVVLLGTARVAGAPDRVPDVTYLVSVDGMVARTPQWLTLVQPGSPERPVPLSTSFDVLLTGASPWASMSSVLIPGSVAARAHVVEPMGTPYTQVVVSPAGEVVAVCQQRVVGWVPPCLLDGTSAVP